MSPKGGDSPEFPFKKKGLNRLFRELKDIRGEMAELEESQAELLNSLAPVFRRSGANLVHYLALRKHDLRPLQETLAELGLSSMGRAEAHVMASLDSTMEVLSALAGKKFDPARKRVGFKEGKKLLHRHTEALLGPPSKARATRIMVTMPSEAATDYLLVRELVGAGMECMRINCAHDDREAWGRMAENLARANRDLGMKCRLLMDVGGPKLRTGPVRPGPAVMKIRPVRDELGTVLRPALVLFVSGDPSGEPLAEADAVIPVPGAWLKSLTVGDEVLFTDRRGSARRILITDKCGGGFAGALSKTAYVTPGTMLVRRPGQGAGQATNVPTETPVGEIFPAPGFIRLKKGDALFITRGEEPGCGAVLDESGRVVSAAVIGCAIPEVFESVRKGERVFLDDGKIAGVVRAVSKKRIKVEITAARPEGSRLGAEKGLNLPDTRLKLSPLTEKDFHDLEFVVRHADIVGMSFAQEPEDVIRLAGELKRLKARRLGIILKVETRRGFEMLPDLLLAAMGWPKVGIMIARGDLAVECGYERLAEIQEEMLWISEAAHVPVVWATQVLENLAKTGIPSRAEITDAAMGVRAECVMLNKGPNIVDTVRVLDNILRRMSDHQFKKISRLRKLHWWGQSGRRQWEIRKK